MSKERIQAQISPLTNARAWAIKEKTGAGIGFQLDLAHELWAKANHPEIYESVTAEDAPVEQTKKKRK